MAKTYLPDTDAGLLAWSDHFNTGIAVNFARWG